MFKVNKKDTRTTYTFCTVSIIGYEQVNMRSLI